MTSQMKHVPFPEDEDDNYFPDRDDQWRGDDDEDDYPDEDDDDDEYLEAYAD